MFIIEIAAIKIAIHNRYDFVKEHCKDYIIQSDDYDFSVEVSERDLSAEKTASGNNFSDGFIESVCIYRNIAKRLPYYDAFVLHCAAIEKNGDAFCFAARSGVGKTTHALLWQKVFSDATIINGDKPIIRFFDGKPFVCGTPWGGKENFQSNRIVPLKSICFLNRATENSIKRLSIHESLSKILKQVFILDDKEHAEKTIDLLGKLLESVTLWSLNCNISESAAILAYETMHKGE